MKKRNKQVSSKVGEKVKIKIEGETIGFSPSPTHRVHFNPDHSAYLPVVIIFTFLYSGLLGFPFLF